MSSDRAAADGATARDFRQHEGAAGFTLLEIIVAMTILALTVALLMPGIANALRLQTGADGERAATLLAQSKLAEIAAGRVEPGARSGVADGALAWRSEVTPLSSGVALASFAVAVTVQPQRGPAVRLATVMLGSPP